MTWISASISSSRSARPNFKLLFDIYHVQIMNGDVIRRLRTAQGLHRPLPHRGQSGPRRAGREAGDQLPAIMKAIIETGYDDFIAQEFIPTWSDPILALRHACMVCDV